jgi:RND family efflux transporter MFP subunit
MNTRLRLVLLAGVVAVAGCSEEPPVATESHERPVLSVIAKPSAQTGASFAGTLSARTETDHAFRMLGRVDRRAVDAGDAVRKGDLLAALDPLALQLAVRAAEADLVNARAEFENAAGAEMRMATLFASGTIAASTLDDAVLQRKSAEASVKRAEAALDKATEQLGYAGLRAEFDGIVTAVHVEAGQTVNAGESVVSVAASGDREVVVDVADDFASGLLPGTAFTVTSPVDPGVAVAGTLREIAPAADRPTRTRRLRITLVDPPVAWRLGATLNASIDLAAGSAFDLPVAALAEADGRTIVWIVDPQSGSVSPREVTVGSRTADTVRIVDGLAPGTRVAIAGLKTFASPKGDKVASNTH